MKAQNKVLRFSMFALLYFTQGTIQGYFVSINALYLKDNGIDIAQVGVFAAIAMIPFIIRSCLAYSAIAIIFSSWVTASLTF